jgi:hypothetical protein
MNRLPRIRWWEGLLTLAVIVIAVGGALLFARIEDERAARAASITGIIDLFCSDNNAQDRTLAHLVEVSLSGDASFGAGLDPNALTPFDIQVLTSIGKVQELTEDNSMQRVFRQELANLQDEDNCEGLISKFLAGEEIEAKEPEARP